MVISLEGPKSVFGRCKHPKSKSLMKGKLLIALFVSFASSSDLTGQKPEPVAEPAGGWSYLERMGSNGDAGPIQGVASTPIGGNRIATAVRNAAGNLKVILWQVEYDGSVTRLGSEEGEPMERTRLAIGSLQRSPETKVTRARFVTAIRNKTGKLKLTVWTTREDGSIVRRGSRKTGEIEDAEFALTTFGVDLVVTAVHDSLGRLKLISWRVNSDGTLSRLKDFTGEKVDQISLATYDSFPTDTGRLATAVTTQNGKLEISAWSLDSDDGEFHPLDTFNSRTGMKDVAAATLSHRRIATAAQDFQDQLVVQTWDFDASGHISLHSSAGAGEISTLDMTTQNAARVVTAVRDASGQLALITWDAIDELVRLGIARTGAVDRLSVVSLGSDWLGTPVRDAAGNMKVIAWREHSISLLHGQWTPSNTAPVQVGTADRFEPGVEGLDPHIAVGNNYIVISNNLEIGFFDKKGNRFGNAISTNEFFATFLLGKLADGSPNEHSIQRHTGFPPKGASDQFPPGSSVHCDPDSITPSTLSSKKIPPPCIGQFNDARVYFDQTSKRFFVVTSVRPPKCVKDVTSFRYGNCASDQTPVSKAAANPLYRRYWAFAVSKTEDPRDGFYQWMSTEPTQSFDYPRFSVNGAVMVVGADSAGYVPWVQPMGRKPYVYALSVSDLIDGKPYPRSHKIYPSAFFHDEKFSHTYAGIGKLDEAYPEVFPLAHHGDTGGRTFLVRGQKEDQPEPGRFDVFSFKHPTDWADFPPVQSTKTVLERDDKSKIEIRSPDMLPVFRDGKIYYAWHKLGASNGTTELRAIRLMRVDLENLSGNPSISGPPWYQTFGSDTVTTECPAITVTEDGHIVILHGRRGYTAPLNHEARYSVWYADSRGFQNGEVIGPGEYLPNTAQYCGSNGGIADYVTAVIDPADEDTAWLIANFPDHSDSPGEDDAIRAIVARVTP
jgi:hypothetical protein